MAYQLEKGESLFEGIKRIGLEEQKAVIEALSNGENAPKSIHTARKHLKKLRALFRLLRDALGAEYYNLGNDYYRDIARNLASLRDITSLIEIAQKIKDKYTTSPGKRGHEELIKCLEQELQNIHLNQEEVFSENIHLLEIDKERFYPLQRNKSDKEKILSGLHRVYKRGYRGFHQALKKANVENMHDWRKRVKYLWHQFQIIRRAWPVMIQAYISTLKELADLLGDYHDLCLLEEKAETLREKLPKDFMPLFKKIIQQEKKKNLEASLQLGMLIYAEKPGAFRRRMGGMI